MSSNAEDTTPAQGTGRITVVALVMAILSASLIYALVALDTASELRTRNALDQNSAAAQISARLLDDQWQDVLLATHELTHHSSLESDLLVNNSVGMARELKYAVDLVPALMLAAVYTNRGVLVSCYPESPVAPHMAAGQAWFEGVKSQKALYQSDSMRIRLPGQLLSEVIAIAIPLGDKPQPSGYMLALYRVGDVDRWLRDLGMQGSDLYIVNSRGHVVDSSTGADRRVQFTKDLSFRMAMGHSFGSLISHHFYSDEDADVGYAYAIKPGWAVVIARPVSLALAPTRSLVGRLALLGVIVLALLATGTTLMLRLYRTQNRMALALTRQNAQLRQAGRIKSDFLANVSHDLRTPLATMQISISSLLEPELAWEPEEVKDNLRVASDSLDQISSRVRNLLEMARLEAHIWPLNKQVCDLTDVVGAALERMKLLTSGRDLRLRFPESPLLLECDPNQIETVIVNLLENATKYSPAGSTIGLSGVETDGWLRLNVEDNGPGIPVEDLDNIFEKFYRSKRHVFVGGTGLGLAICKSIIEAHGGSVGACNRIATSTHTDSQSENQAADSIDQDEAVVGAHFWFSLPALYGASGEANE